MSQLVSFFFFSFYFYKGAFDQLHACVCSISLSILHGKKSLHDLEAAKNLCLYKLLAHKFEIKGGGRSFLSMH